MRPPSAPVAPTSLREYATARGWVQVREALKDGLVVLNHKEYSPRQLVYPTSSSVPGYAESVSVVVHRLAEIEGRPVLQLVRDVQRVHEDTYRFRLFDDRSDDDSIAFGYALSAIKGSEQLLLSSATTVLMPRAYHPRLGMKEAQRFLEQARFNHTEEGSFVLNVSCPVNALDKGGVEGLFGMEEHDTPLVRKTSLALANGLQQIVKAIEEDAQQEFVDRVKADSKPVVSANLAGALDYFAYEGSKHALEVRVDWASSLPGPKTGHPSIITIQRDYFPLVREIREALRPKEEIVEEEYIGTVETLNGDPGPDGRRAGEVTLRIQPRDSDELVRARVILNADQYNEAIEAHKEQNAYISVKGKLQDGRQPRALTDIASFNRLGKVS